MLLLAQHHTVDAKHLKRGDHMARKPMSEEQKQAASERMKAMHAAKKASKTNSTPSETNSGINLTQEQFDQLINRLTVAEAAIAYRGVTPDQALDAKAEMTGAFIGPNGIQGQIVKYNIEPDWYPDPSERILDMPELSRFAPRQNYEIKWTVTGVEYEKNNISYAEPRFTVEIRRIMFNEYGEPTTQRAIVGRHIQHEDENVTRMVARDMGFQDLDERKLRDEVRFQRIRRWVLDMLTPMRQPDRVDNVIEMAIDGKVIPVIDISTNADKAVMVNTDSALKNQLG
jgi:hypothetical protein